MQARLSACPSAPHRAILGLLPVSLGLSPDAGLAADLAASDPEDLAAIAQAGHVHVLMHSAFRDTPALREAVPDDLLVYFEAMHEANRARNAQAREQLRRIGEILHAGGLRACALKGGAELLVPHWTDTDGRFLQDLDVLVEAPASAALEALQAAGASWAGPPPVPSKVEKMHLPALLMPDGPFAVELHTTVAQSRARDILPPESLWENAVETDKPGLVVPCSLHRAMHHVLHAQVQHLHFARAEIAPRTLVDHVMHRRVLGTGLPDLRRRLADARLATEYDSIDALAMHILYAETGGRSTRTDAWVKKALSAYGAPGRRRGAAVGRLLGNRIGELAAHRHRRRRYLALMLKPRELAGLIRIHLKNITRIR